MRNDRLDVIGGTQGEPDTGEVQAVRPLGSSR